MLLSSNWVHPSMAPGSPSSLNGDDGSCSDESNNSSVSHSRNSSCISDSMISGFINNSIQTGLSVEESYSVFSPYRRRTSEEFSLAAGPLRSHSISEEFSLAAGILPHPRKNSEDFSQETSTLRHEYYPRRISEVLEDESIEDESIEDESSDDEKDEKKKVTVISDESSDQNLFFVYWMIRYPFQLFFCILALAVAISLVSINLVVQSGGNPFVSPTIEYVASDVRTLQYNSIRLAQQEIFSRSDAQIPTPLAVEQRVDRHRKHNDTSARFLKTDSENTLQTSETTIDSVTLVFESKNSNQNIFGSSESIQQMKSVVDMFIIHPDYEKYCRKNVLEISNRTQDLNLTEAPTQDQESRLCMPPETALNMYYASEWDSYLVQAVIEQLTPSNIDRYNELSSCIEYNINCVGISSKYNTTHDFEWAYHLDRNISLVTSSWGLDGPLQTEHLEQITLFAAHLLQLDTKRGLVDFGFDKQFTVSNPKSKYSRAKLFWETASKKSTTPINELQQQKYNLGEKHDQSLIKRFIVDEFLEELDNIGKTSYSPEISVSYYMVDIDDEVFWKSFHHDALLSIASFLLVFLYLRIAIKSWFLASVGILCGVLTIAISWFVYTLCFRIKYFSILNVLAMFIIIAMGVDGTIIFMDAYHESAKGILKKSLVVRMSWIYRGAVKSMFYSTATSCASFLCVLLTPLPGVRAFGIFAATVILLRYLLLISLFGTAVVIYHNKFEGISLNCGRLIGSFTKNRCGRIQLLECKKQTQSEKDETGFDLRKRFCNKLGSFVLHPSTRGLLGVCIVAWLAISLWFCFQLRPIQQSQQYIQENHPIKIAEGALASRFIDTQWDQNVGINIAWGIKEPSRQNIHPLLDPMNLGTPQFVESFDFNEVCQTQLFAACEVVKTHDAFAPYIKKVDGVRSVSCFMEELAAFWALNSLEDCELVRSGSWKNQTWQVPTEYLHMIMPNFLQENSCYSNEVATVKSYYDVGLGWDGSRMLYAGLTFESAVFNPYQQQSRQVARAQYDGLMAIVADLNKNVTKYCGSGGDVVMTDLDRQFIFMYNQDIYSQKIWRSALLGIAMAFIGLLVASRVLHVAIFATISISFVVVSVCGIISMIGWELGSLENSWIAVVPGFSVGYFLHFAYMYSSVDNVYRTTDRIGTTFDAMGMTLFHSMITTVSASIPLFFCQTLLFQKTGVLLVITAVVSWFFSNLCFTSILATARLPIKVKRQSQASRVVLCPDTWTIDEEAGVQSTNENDDQNMEFSFIQKMKGSTKKLEVHWTWKWNEATTAILVAPARQTKKLFSWRRNRT